MAIVRPVDAAGLVLLRGDRGHPEVLLGRRHGRAGFLPDIYVVPGGRVDPQDQVPAHGPEKLNGAVAADLARGTRRSPLAFVRAALRETHEETGLTLTKVDGIDFICRAITPTYSHRRYNTRFFLADGADAEGDLGGDGELEDLAWRPVARLGDLAIVDVTRFVLLEALRRWQAGIPAGAEPARLYCYRGDSARWRPGPTEPWQPWS